MERPLLLDRKYQNDLLTFLLHDFPLFEKTMKHCEALRKEDDEKFIANIVYLEKHGLIEDGPSIRFSGTGDCFVGGGDQPRITEKGIDFILDDGGLGAILNVQTVKLHPDTIRDLLANAVEASSLTQEQKDSFLDQIKSVPADLAKDLLGKLVGKGADVALGQLTQITDLLL